MRLPQMVAAPVRLPLCLLRVLQDMVEAGSVWECDDPSQNSRILLFHSYLSRAPKSQPLLNANHRSTARRPAYTPAHTKKVMINAIVTRPLQHRINGIRTSPGCCPLAIMQVASGEKELRTEVEQAVASMLELAEPWLASATMKK